MLFLSFFFSSSPLTSKLDIVTFYFLYKTGFFCWCWGVLVFFNKTQQASSCQQWHRERFFALWKQNRNREELTTIIQLVTRWNGLLAYSLMTKHCRFFFFFSDSEITQLLFVTNLCSVTLSGWHLPISYATGDWNWSCSISCLNCLCESCLQTWKCAFVLSLVHSSTVCL